MLCYVIGDAYYAPNNTIQGQLHAIRHLTDNQYYSAFRERVAVEGVFDDHDYGVNDAGKHITHYHTRKLQYLQFLYNYNRTLSHSFCDNSSCANNCSSYSSDDSINICNNQFKSTRNNGNGSAGITSSGCTCQDIIAAYYLNKMRSSGFVYDDYSGQSLFQYLGAHSHNNNDNSNNSSIDNISNNNIYNDKQDINKSNYDSDVEDEDGSWTTCPITDEPSPAAAAESESVEQPVDRVRGVYKSFDTFLTTSDTKLKAKVKFILLDTRSFRDYHYIPSVGKSHSHRQLQTKPYRELITYHCLYVDR
jgi:hypothetical protein